MPILFPSASPVLVGLLPMLIWMLVLLIVPFWLINFPMHKEPAQAVPPSSPIVTLVPLKEDPLPSVLSAPFPISFMTMPVSAPAHHP